MSDPRVSVVITAYNLGWCIEDTLRSVFNQTYSNLEIIVVDDASTDDTATRLAAYAHRIKYIRHATNQGLLNGAEAGPARNSGVAAATGDYVALLDGDDLWEPDKIAIQVEAAQRFPNAGLIVTDGVSFSHDDGRTLRSTLLFDATDRFFAKLPDDAVVSADLYRRFLHDCLIDTPSQVMIARRVFDAIGVFSECRCDDYEFYVRATAEFDVAVVKAPLVRYRQHDANLSGASALQFFRFVQPNLDIWRHHLRTCRADVRPLVNQRIKRALRVAADRATAEGRKTDRAWAAGFLMGLIRRNVGSTAVAYVAYRLVLLYLPAKARSLIRQTVGWMRLQLPTMVLAADASFSI